MHFTSILALLALIISISCRQISPGYIYGVASSLTGPENVEVFYTDLEFNNEPTSLGVTATFTLQSEQFPAIIPSFDGSMILLTMTETSGRFKVIVKSIDNTLICTGEFPEFAIAGQFIDDTTFIVLLPPSSTVATYKLDITNTNNCVSPIYSCVISPVRPSGFIGMVVDSETTMLSVAQRFGSSEIHSVDTSAFFVPGACVIDSIDTLGSPIVGTILLLRLDDTTNVGINSFAETPRMSIAIDKTTGTQTPYRTVQSSSITLPTFYPGFIAPCVSINGQQRQWRH